MFVTKKKHERDKALQRSANRQLIFHIYELIQEVYRIKESINSTRRKQYRRQDMQFPRHKASMTIEHNEHKACYESVHEYTRGKRDCWVSEEERTKAMKTDELWSVQWYPDTPIGSYTVYASTLEAALEAAVRIQEEADSGRTAYTFT